MRKMIALVVDDHPMVRFLHAELLVKREFKVHMCSSAEEALRKLAELKVLGDLPSIILTDYMFDKSNKVMNGLMLARRVLEDFPEVGRVVIVTSKVKVREDLVGTSIGFVEKPFGFEDLDKLLSGSDFNQTIPLGQSGVSDQSCRLTA